MARIVARETSWAKRRTHNISNSPPRLCAPELTGTYFSTGPRYFCLAANQIVGGRGFGTEPPQNRSFVENVGYELLDVSETPERILRFFIYDLSRSRRTGRRRAVVSPLP